MSSSPGEVRTTEALSEGRNSHYFRSVSAAVTHRAAALRRDMCVAYPSITCWEPEIYVAAQIGDRDRLEKSLEIFGPDESPLEVADAVLSAICYPHLPTYRESALEVACRYKQGGAGKEGWAGCVALLLRLGGASPRCDEWVASGSRTALCNLVIYNPKNWGNRPMFACLAALLAYGADARVKSREVRRDASTLCCGTLHPRCRASSISTPASADGTSWVYSTAS